jgi:adenylate kinase family enzyme
MKLLIIGNAGCGKTYLAKKLAKQKKIPIYHIDHLWFKPGGYSIEFERTPTERKNMIKKIMAQKNYIIEGASGITAKQFAKVATHLMFIGYPVKVCINSIKTRKLDKGQKSSPEQTAWLVNFAKEYYSPKNKGSVSLYTHKEIFDEFSGSKYFIATREDANKLQI